MGATEPRPARPLAFRNTVRGVRVARVVKGFEGQALDSNVYLVIPGLRIGTEDTVDADSADISVG